jgi:hypothetical protein
MSAITETIITCDGSATDCHGNDWSADQRHRSAKEQRDNARREGWHCFKGEDYCPACWKHRQATRKETP